MDGIISLAATLFILSMISERIVNFIKLEFSNRKFLFWQFGNLKDIEDNDDGEDKRDKRLIGLNIVFGSIIALLIRADLINILKDAEHPGNTLGWDTFVKQLPWSGITLLPGCFLTGCFLSLGSKFWHDLVDLLLQVKDYRKKLNSIQDMKINSIGQLDDFVTRNEFNVFELFLEEQLKKYNILTFAADLDHRTVTVFTSGQSGTLPDQFQYKSLSGAIFPIKVIETTNVKFTTTSRLFPASQVSNEHPLTNVKGDVNAGSIGFFVYDFNKTTRYILTCFHVIWNQHDWFHFEPHNGLEYATSPINGIRIGQIKRAMRNSMVDVALIVPEPGIILDEQISQVVPPGQAVKSRTVTQDDINSLVKMNGVESGFREGFLIAIHKDGIAIEYPDGKNWSLDDLLFIRSKDGQPFSVGGDSGSILTDGKGDIIGLVVAGDPGNALSIAIPFSNIEDQLSVKL